MSDDPDLRDLPSLERWGERLRDAAERDERRSGRRRFPLRRAVLAAGVMLLVVPGAIATRSIWTEPIDQLDPVRRDPMGASAVILAEGRSGAVAWQMGAYDRRDGQHCVQLQTDAGSPSVGGTCLRPLGGPAQINVGTAFAGGRSFAFGTVGPRAVRVAVTVAGRRPVRAATLASDGDVFRRGRLEPRRAFVVAYPGGFDASRPVQVVAYDAGGRVLGTTPGARR